MLLKSLELQGFKTFPDKTKLTFNKGITSVVGPNGSGKSNISDAIRWVLGEQSPKTLRCSKMEDVVFNGTVSRKRQGFAEVTLTIENKDRLLPFDGDEVAVTRRYYRSGESEYLINKATVRLKDIHELFMDTGLGRDGYSMISQGKIDSIVASRSEDRREIFEEAAGISRYRYRKIEAERKLSQAEENLLRLRDILTELEDRVLPLKQQAEKAKAFLEYSAEKRGLEIGLWLNTLDKSAAVLREQEEKISVAKSQHNGIISSLEKISQETEEIYNNISGQAITIEKIRHEISELEGQISQKRSEISVYENDILHNNENIKRIEGEIEQVEISFRNIQTVIDEKRNLIEEHKTSIEKLQKEFSEQSGRLNNINDDVIKTSDKLQGLTEKLSRLNASAADARVAEMTARTSVNEINARINTIDAALATKNTQLSDLEQMFSDYQTMCKDAVQRVNSAANAVKGYELRLNNRQQKRDELKSKADKLMLDAQEKIRHTRLLEELERNLEGFSQSVKVVMKEASRGTISGIHGPASRVISVPSEYTVAIETALGAAMQNIVTTNEEDAKRAIKMLKQRDAGRATFLPMTTIRGNELQEKGIDDCYGFVGIASRLCSCEPKYNGILYSLLGRIVVAEDLDCAASIAKKYNYKFKVVTLDGQVVNAGGSLTGGSLARKSGLLSRVAEIENSKKLAEQLRIQAEQAKEELKKAESDAAAAEAQLMGARGELASAQEERIKTDAECKSCETELENLRQSVKELKSEKLSNAKRSEELIATCNSAAEYLEKYNEQISEVEQSISEITGSRQELSEKREQIASLLQEIRLKIVTLNKDIEALDAEIKHEIETGLDQETKKKSLRVQIDELNVKNEQIRSTLALLSDEVTGLNGKVNDCKTRISELNETRMELERRSSQLRQIEREKSNEKENLGRELARLEERKINLQKQYDEIISKLWEEYELTKREAEETAPKIDDYSKAQRTLNELKLKIKSLGHVNVSAIEEYKEVSERYEFMKAQIEDVERSKNEITKLIGELTKQMKELFVERFNQINENFSSTFIELFGGGKASLALSNPDDVLTSGIEIVVHPPGKIVVHLEALSGGEKALVAISLYFAIMKVRPAPFCVMDEIEAALDEVNVDRFAAYLRRMNDNTQFILITHRRGTMEEADVLYGVTMQDEGISKLLELRASEIEQKLGIKA